MHDTKVTRAEAAAARREAIRIKDGDVTPHGIRLSRYSTPLDVGPVRRLHGSADIKTSLHWARQCTGADIERSTGWCGSCIARLAEEEIDPLEVAPGWVKFTGIASVVNTPYEMWDIFGPYTERVAATAFDASLGSTPDVAFLANHTGLTMARTIRDTLALHSSFEGLGVEAWAEYDRHDVHDFTRAVQSGCIDQMSFAAFLEEGEWDDAMENFTMTRLDLHCGDVSGVNFGANPHTSISARAHRVLEEIDRLPAGVARIATKQLEHRLGAISAPYRHSMGINDTAEGRSLALIRAAMLADED